MAVDAGLSDIVLTSRPEYVRTMCDAQDPLYRRILEHLPPGAGAADYITSLEGTARKALAASGAGRGCCGPVRAG